MHKIEWESYFGIFILLVVFCLLFIFDCSFCLYIICMFLSIFYVLLFVFMTQYLENLPKFHSQDSNLVFCKINVIFAKKKKHFVHITQHLSLAIHVHMYSMTE